MSEIRAELPGDLGRIVRRCLEKEPRHRLQTARDVGDELRDLTRQTSRESQRRQTRPARIPCAADRTSGAVRAEEGFWVAVLPFKYSGSNADVTALADGLTEDIVTGLSRFSYLRVIARSSTAHYASEVVDVRTAGKELGARYVMEGSLRQAGTKLRLAVQLVDAATGAHLWAETYERPFSPEAIFELQDDLVPRIVSTVADMYGVLPRSMSEAVRRRDPERLRPYEAVLRSFAYFERFTAGGACCARRCARVAPFEQAARLMPTRWAMLSALVRPRKSYWAGIQPCRGQLAGQPPPQPQR